MIYTQGPDGKFRIAFEKEDLGELELIEKELIRRKTKKSIEIAHGIRYGINEMKKEKEDNLPF